MDKEQEKKLGAFYDEEKQDLKEWKETTRRRRKRAIGGPGSGGQRKDKRGN